MPSLKPAYLIHGDDHGAIGERRARLKALGECAGKSERPTARMFTINASAASRQ
jgi:DNA polymerase III delta subunit